MVVFLPNKCISALKLIHSLLAQNERGHLSFVPPVQKRRKIKGFELSAPFRAKLNQTFFVILKYSDKCFFTSHFWLGLEQKWPQISKVSPSCEIFSAGYFYFFVIFLFLNTRTVGNSNKPHLCIKTQTGIPLWLTVLNLTVYGFLTLVCHL